MQSLELLRQGAHVMTVCNACRYCEQFCPVFPTMEMRAAFGARAKAHGVPVDCRHFFDRIPKSGTGALVARTAFRSARDRGAVQRPQR